MLETPLAPTVACGHTVVNTQVFFPQPIETRRNIVLGLAFIAMVKQENMVWTCKNADLSPV